MAASARLRFVRFCIKPLKLCLQSVICVRKRADGTRVPPHQGNPILISLYFSNNINKIKVRQKATCGWPFYLPDGNSRRRHQAFSPPATRRLPRSLRNDALPRHAVHLRTPYRAAPPVFVCRSAILARYPILYPVTPKRYPGLSPILYSLTCVNGGTYVRTPRSQQALPGR